MKGSKVFTGKNLKNATSKVATSDGVKRSRFQKYLNVKQIERRKKQ